MENKDVRYWCEEMQRCKDFVYFYNKYVRKENQEELTQENYRKWLQMAVSVREWKRIKDIGKSFGLMTQHPLMPDQCLPLGEMDKKWNEGSKNIIP